MKHFVKKAGNILVIAVFFLSVLNSFGIEDGVLSFGNEDSQNSVLAFGGKAIGPVFEPMGIGEENWPVSVALFTGLFAKEAILEEIGADTLVYKHIATHFTVSLPSIHTTHR